MPKSKTFSRRDFLTSTAAAGAFALSARSYARVIGANDRINVGIIGCGGMAGGHLGALLNLREEDNIELLAVTDVYRKRAEGFQDRIADAAQSLQRAFDQPRQVLLHPPQVTFFVELCKSHRQFALPRFATMAGTT